ncbi:biotin--[acetyl-CoA-carboxylase] ligase [Lacinutrix salivirga]
MPIIKLNAIDSTNAFLKQLCSDGFVEDYTVVVAKNQTNGRGQMGTAWSSQDAKNLTFSVFKALTYFKFRDQFYLNIVVSLAMIKTLEYYKIPKLSVKWPNDILSADKKIAGILIENVIKQQDLSSSVIGIGLNVNQTEFENLPKASSLQLITGEVFDLDKILNRFLIHLKACFFKLETKALAELKAEYEALLFKKNKPSTFKNEEGLMFSGFIKGVTETGHLKVLLEDNILKTYDLKQITLLY